MDKYWTGAHTKHRLRYHLVWIPKSRKRVLTGAVAARLDELLRQACATNRWGLEELNIQPDHVHLLVQARPPEDISGIIRLLRVPLPCLFPSENLTPDGR